MEFLQNIWQLMNSPIGLGASGFVLLIVLKQLYAAKPGWEKHEGYMISAIKYAEKWIPDDTDNKVLNKADKALEYFIQVFEKGNGKSPSKRLKKQIMLGLPIIHEKLEQSGTLNKKLDEFKKQFSKASKNFS